jgi:hypothetical protein
VDQAGSPSRNELLGQPIEMVVPERYRPNHPGLRTAFFAGPASRPKGAGRDLYGLRKDGSEFPVEIGLNRIKTDEGTMVLSAVVDISDRTQKEKNSDPCESRLRYRMATDTGGWRPSAATFGLTQHAGGYPAEARRRHLKELCPNYTVDTTTHKC